LLLATGYRPKASPADYGLRTTDCEPRTIIYRPEFFFLLLAIV